MTTTEKGIVSDIARAADWLADGNNNWTRLRRMINEQWAPRPAAFSGLTYAYFGGYVLTGAVYSAVADGTIALTDNATNYVERTAAGVVSKNTSGFSNSPSIPMAKVTTLSGAITAIVEARFYAPVDTGGSGSASLIGSAGFNASSGSIASAVYTGIVSGVTRTGTGSYSVAFTSPEADVNYLVAGMASADNIAATFLVLSGIGSTTYATTGFTFQASVPGSTPRDPQVVRISIFR